MKHLITYIKEELATPMNTTGMGDVDMANGFCVLKPGFISHDKDFKKRLQDKGWNVLKDVKLQLNDQQSHDLYIPHKDKPFYNDLCKYMTSDYSHAYLCYKDCKDPIKDMDSLKDEIRKEWGKDEMKNAMHSSDSLDNVKRESDIYFNINENKIVYKHDKKYDEFLYAIQMLPEDIKTELIKKYNHLKNDGKEINTDELLNDLNK